MKVTFADPSYVGEVMGGGERGVRHVRFCPASTTAPSFDSWLGRVGHVPLPPYIDRPDEPGDRERYQTVFARDPGSVAAPTAALHFTEETLAALRAHGVELAFLTLHVGPGTFRPVAGEDPELQALDPEPYRVPPETAEAVARARERAGRVIAVGTTSVRALESWARDSLLILPPYEFRVVAGMITNFHLPRTSLLMLVSALAGRNPVLRAYDAAVAAGYRFYSYGDAMLVT